MRFYSVVLVSLLFSNSEIVSLFFLNFEFVCRDFVFVITIDCEENKFFVNQTFTLWLDLCISCNH